MTQETINSEEKSNKGDIEEHQTNHDYDGIKELNNPAPFWIALIFIITIVFSMVYTIHNFGFPGNGRDQVSEYETKVEAFEIKKAEMRMAAMGDGAELDPVLVIKAGTKLYTDKGCTVCHGNQGEGNNIGPNLTDNNWINGCSTDNIIEIITEGKPQKGMTPYKSIMTEDQIKHLATYIKKGLVGSNPNNPKAPQGEECTDK
jgi:cytochrome c oxidase cbb3-type subunit III